MFFSKGIQAFAVTNLVNMERLDARKMKMEEGKAQVFAAGGVGRGWGVVGTGVTLVRGCGGLERQKGQVSG